MEPEGERFDLPELLAWAQCPREVLAWAREERALRVSLDEIEDAMALLERAPTVEAAVWLAAALTIPLDLIASAVIVVVETAGEDASVPIVAEACALAMDSVAGNELGSELLAFAERCEARRGQANDAAGYRDPDPRERQVLVAAAASCRAAEALGAARVRIAFELEVAAATRVSILGAGSIIGPSAKAILGDRTPPFVLARPAFGERAVPHDLRAGVGLLADALTSIAERDPRAVTHAFLDALATD